MSAQKPPMYRIPGENPSELTRASPMTLLVEHVRALAAGAVRALADQAAFIRQSCLSVGFSAPRVLL